MLLVYSPIAIGPDFSSQIKTQSLKDKLQRSLRLAGMYDKTPSVMIIGLVGVTTVVGLVVGVITGNPLVALAAIPIVPAGAHYMLMMRQRQFVVRASDEIVPFLNRIATSVKAGRPVPQAYVQAVEESGELKRILAASAAKITSGARFSDAIVETIDALPLRMWSIFVRQVEAFDSGGGDLATGLEKTIKQINMVLQLNSEARADYATQARQQKLIVIIVIGGIAFFTLSVDPAMMKTLWTTPMGIIGMLVAFAVMGGGMWFSRKQMRDIEKKLNF